MIYPAMALLACAVLGALSFRFYQKLLSLRHRLNSAENAIAALQSAAGVQPIRPPEVVSNPDASTKEMIEFLLFQVAGLKTAMRLNSVSFEPVERTQTMGSFDYQWGSLTEGEHLPSDPKFMASVKAQLCEITDLPEAWFKDKEVVDVGCGLGRFTFGLLSMGAKVTAVDQSPNGLQRVKELCAQFSDRLKTHQANILKDPIPGIYDLVYSFGVLHHTGNTYQAMLNTVKLVRPGGKLFLMLYGYPVNPTDFVEQNSYDRLRRKLRNTPFQEKVEYLKKHFDPKHVHGWFDAVSPRINDLLTFDEIEDFLLQLGFHKIKRTKDNANLHLVAERLA